MRRIVILAAAILSLACSCSNLEEDEAIDIPGLDLSVIKMDIADKTVTGNPYMFNGVSKSKDWKDVNKRDALCQIPEDRLDQMNALDLALTCIFYYPRRTDIIYFDAVTFVSSVCCSRNNGFDRLFKMRDSGEAMLAILEKMDFEKALNGGKTLLPNGGNVLEDPFYQSYICYILASKDFAVNMSDDSRMILNQGIDQLIELHKANPDKGPNISALYAVRARLLTIDYPLTGEETKALEQFINYKAEGCHADDISYIDSLVEKYR